MCLVSAALAHGWKVEVAPPRPQVAVPKDRRIPAPLRTSLQPIWTDLDVEPQVAVRGPLGLDVRPDLVDVRLRLVLEADSFEWHGDRAALRRDARRYDLLVADGWTVLRFAYEDVMHDQDWVRRVLVSTVERTQQRAGLGA